MSNTEFQCLSGTRCSLEVAEIPSLLFEKLVENWGTIKALGASDHNMASFENWKGSLFNNILTKKSQLKLAYADQLLHDNINISEKEISNICRQAENFVGLPKDSDTWIANVPHLTNYGGCYYSYQLAEFIVEKILSKLSVDYNFGKHLRESLFSKGGTVNPIRSLNSLGIKVNF